MDDSEEDDDEEDSVFSSHSFTEQDDDLPIARTRLGRIRPGKWNFTCKHADTVPFPGYFVYRHPTRMETRVLDKVLGPEKMPDVSNN